MRFGTWNVRSLYAAGSLKTVARELGKYMLDLVGVQEVRWDKGGTERVEEYTFFYREGNEDHQLGTGFFMHKRIISAVRRVEFVGDRMSYITLRGRWCNIIVLNVHTPCEDKSDDVKDRFCEELGHVFDQFPRYNMKILLGDFSAKVGSRQYFIIKILYCVLFNTSEIYEWTLHVSIRRLKFMNGHCMTVDTCSYQLLQY
jgi:exonuclease III